MENDSKIIDIILAESKKLQDVLNNHFLKEFAKLHNIPEEYSKFYAKQEIVAKRAYFQTEKKHYALHIVNKEEVPVDEVEIKGLVTRRSDYPRITKEGIKYLLDYVLKEEKISFKYMREYIDSTEQKILEMLKVGDRNAGRPVTFSQEIGDYKRIPGHVLAMQVWNDLEYNYFVHGSKGYYFQCSIDNYTCPDSVREKLGKYQVKDLKAIVLPYEEDNLPSYYNVNIDEMIKFCWTNRVEELFDPILEKMGKQKLEVSTW